MQERCLSVHTNARGRLHSGKTWQAERMANRHNSPGNTFAPVAKHVVAGKLRRSAGTCTVLRGTQLCEQVNVLLPR